MLFSSSTHLILIELYCAKVGFSTFWLHAVGQYNAAFYVLYMHIISVIVLDVI